MWWVWMVCAHAVVFFLFLRMGLKEKVAMGREEGPNAMIGATGPHEKELRGEGRRKGQRKEGGGRVRVSGRQERLLFLSLLLTGWGTA